MAGKPSLSPSNPCPLTSPPEKPNLHMPGARCQGISTEFATRPSCPTCPSSSCCAASVSPRGSTGSIGSTARKNPCTQCGGRCHPGVSRGDPGHVYLGLPCGA